MCGVFGFVGQGAKGRPDLGKLVEIATVTERRGPHAFGFAWIDGRGRMGMYKQRGRITHNLGLLTMLADARMVIGHTRYATAGNPADNQNNHPHPCDGGWMVHNGVVAGHLDIAERLGLHPVTDCDSEVLAMLIADGRGKLKARCLGAAAVAEPMNLVMLGLWKPGRLVAVRKGNPLHLSRDTEGTYLASLADGLADPKVMGNDKALEWRI